MVKQNGKKRGGERTLLSVVIAAAFVVAAFAMISADDPSTADEGAYLGANEISLETGKSLDSLFPLSDHDSEGSGIFVITLEDDIECKKTLTVSGGMDVTINLEGFDLSFDIDDTEAPVINVTSGGKLTINGDGGTLILQGTTNESGILVYNADARIFANIDADTIEGSVVYADNSSTVLIEGDITSVSASVGVNAAGGSEIHVKGDIDVGGDQVYGVYASFGSTVTVEGDVTVSGNIVHGVYASFGSTVTVEGDVTVDGDEGAYGVREENTGEITVTGNITVSGDYDGSEHVCGIRTMSGWATIIVEGDINVTNKSGIRAYGVFAWGGAITLTGDIEVNGNNSVGVYASNTTVIIMTGDIEVNGNGGIGVETRYDSTVTVIGSIAVNGDAGRGVDTFTGDAVVKGDVTVYGKDTGGYVYGVFAWGGSVTVGGDITLLDEGAWIYAAGAEVTVDGDLVSLYPSHIRLYNSNEPFSIDPPFTDVESLTKLGYWEVSSDYEWIWIKDPSKNYSISLDLSGDNDFGSEIEGYGYQPDLVVTVKNTGDQPIDYLKITLSADGELGFGSTKDEIFDLDPDAEEIFKITPILGLLAGEYRATVTVSGGGVMNESFEVTFTVVEKIFSVELDPETDTDFASEIEGYGALTPYEVTVTNTGNQPTGTLTIELSGDGASGFELSTDTIASLGVGADDSFTVTPVTGLTKGTYEATVTVSGAGDEILESFTVTFTVIAADHSIELSPAADKVFDPKIEGYGAQPAHTVTVTNKGNVPTGELSIVLSGSGASGFELSTDTIASLAVSGDGSFNSFTVTPVTGLSAGTYTAKVTVSGAGGEISEEFEVKFVVDAQTYSVSLTPSEDKDFGSLVVGYTVPTAHTVLVTNTGNVPTGKLYITLSGDDESFILGGDDEMSLAVGEYMNFSVTVANGLSAGTYTATVTVSREDGKISEGFEVKVVVDAKTYSVSLTPSEDKDFGPAVVEYAPMTPYSVTVKNTGNQLTGTLNITLSGDHASSFIRNKLTVSLGVGGSDTFTIVPYSGLSAGTYNATVTVSGDNGISESFDVKFVVNAPPVITSENDKTVVTGTGGTFQVTATGTTPITYSLAGTVPEGVSIDSLTGLMTITGAVPEGTYTFTVKAANVTESDDEQPFTLYVNPIPTYSVELVPSADKDFGSAVVEYATAPAAHSVAVKNTGNQPTGALTVALSGGSASAFTLSTSSVTNIAVGGSSSFTVRPISGLSVGTYNATVTVSGDNGISESFNVTFTVTAAPVAPEITSDDNTTVVSGTGGTFQVTATGTMPITFLLIGEPAGVTISASGLITITGEVPAGTYTFTVEASNAAPSADEQLFTLYVNPVPTYSVVFDPAGDKDFGSAVVEYATAPAAHSVAVKNTGNQPTGVLSISLSGGSASDFILSTPTISSIAVGGTSSSFTVTPKLGLSLGTHKETVTVSGSNGISVSFDVTFFVSSVPTYLVTVTGGSITGGSTIGYYAAGETVNVVAGDPAEGKVFSKWIVTGVTLTAAGDAEISFSMPANAVTLTAEYKDVSTGGDEDGSSEGISVVVIAVIAVAAIGGVGAAYFLFLRKP